MNSGGANDEKMKFEFSTGLTTKNQQVEVKNGKPCYFALIKQTDKGWIFERSLPKDYVEEWPGSASTLETDGMVIAWPA